MAEVDSLVISISGESKTAVDNLNSLVSSLERIRTASKGGAGLSSVSKQLQAIAAASNAINSGGMGKIKELAASIGQLSNVKISSNIAAQLNKLTGALSNVKWTDGDKIQTLVDGIKPLSELGKAQLTTFINQLGKLPAVIAELDKADLGKFASQMKEAAAAMKPLADEMNKVAAGFSAFPARIQKFIQSSSKIPSANKNSANSFGLLGTGISRATAKFGIYYASFRRLASVMGGWVKESNDYVENLNLFTVAMGDYAQSAKAYAEEVQSVMGIDPSEWMRNQGVFMQLATGFGIASDKAALMSKNLTQLGYDITSYFNLEGGIEEGMQKLQSGIAGEIEPLRRLGYAIDVATLQQVAYRNGIEQSVNTMTQAQKAQLRYVAIMEQSSNAMGDLARTIQTPANAMRILQQQVTQLARAAGNLLIPALQKIIPVVQAVVEVLTEAVQALANLFGFQLTQIDYPGLEGVSAGGEEAQDALGGAADAAKDLKNAMLGIDELNVISPPTANAAAGTGLGFGDLNLELPEYDFLKGLEEQTNKIKGILEKILPLVLAIGAALLAWKLGSALLSGLDFLLKNFKLIAGTILFIAGLGTFLYNAYDAFVNGLDWGNLAGMIAGVSLMVAGLALTGRTALAAFAALAGGIVIVGLSVRDAIENGLNNTNLTGILAGITIAVMGLYAAFGKTGAIIGGVIGGVLLLAVGFNDFINNGVTEHNILAIAAGFSVLGIAAAGINPKLGLIIAIVGLAVTAFVGFGDVIFAWGNVIVSAIKNGIAWLGNLFTVTTTVFSNMFHAVLNFGKAVDGAISALIENLKIAFKNGWIQAEMDFIDFKNAILNGILVIAKAVNGLTAVFGLEIDLSGINSRIDELAKKRAELDAQITDYVNVGDAFSKGLSTFDYQSVEDAWNTFDAFEEGWVSDAYNAGSSFGASLQEGLRTSLGGLKDNLSGMLGEATSGISDLFSFGGAAEILDTAAFSKTAADADVLNAKTTDLSAQLEAYKTSLSTMSDSVDTEGMNQQFDAIASNYDLTSQNMLANNQAFSDDTLSKIQTASESHLTALADGEAAAKSATDSMTRMFRNMSSNSVSAINAIISRLNAIPRNITTVHTIITKNVTMGGSASGSSGSSGGSSATAYASGGFPEHGQLFLAREAGPELVGTIGNNTAVANNSQIIAGIKQGVAEAEQSQNALLREQNELLTQILAKTGTYLNGKQVTNLVEQTQRQRGASIMSGGVLVY